MSQTVQSTMKLSKEVSEESYSKTSISSSSTKMMSSSVESSESVASLQRLTSTEGDSNVDSLMKEMLGDRTSLVSKLSDDPLGGSTSVVSSEKSTSIVQSGDEFSYKMAAEMKSSYEKQETSKSISSQSTKEVSMMKSVETSSEKVIEAISSGDEESPATVKVEKEPVYVVIMDYTPREGDQEGLPVSEGQEVEVIDSSRAHKWRVRLRQTTAGSIMMTEGTVPSCYLEKKEAQSPPTTPPVDPKMQLWTQRREKVLKELVESEEDFSRDMQFVVNNYIKEMESKQMPKDLRDYKDTLFTNFKAISEFHNNVLMKGIQYYGSEPARLGKTFLRLERDFDMHVAYCRDEPEAQQLLNSGPLKDYFDKFSKKLDDEKTLSEHLKLPIQRINDYQLLLKELIKYTARLKEDTFDLEKAHDFMQAIPQRIEDLQYLNSIQGYKGNIHKLGRILKRDWFEVTDGNNLRKERFVFLFKGRMFVTDTKRVGLDRQIFLVKYIIKFADVEIVDNADDDELKLRFQHLKKGQAGFPLTLKAKTMEQKEDWLKVIQVTAIPQGLEDLGDEEPEPIIEEPEAKKTKLEEEKIETKVEILEDFEAYEEMHTVITESVRSGSLTSLDDFHSALEDEPSLCFTASEMESGNPGRPRFVKPLRASSCVEGSVATLECEVAASPSPAVAWLKDNQPLQPSSRATLEADGAKQRLVLKNAEGNDGGLYTIIASNVHGTMSCSAPLAVHSGPETLPPSTPGGSPMPYGPVFVEKLRDMELQEGTAFRVSTVVQGEPFPTVSFYKDDQEIKKEGRVHFVPEGKDCYELVIENVLPEDSGKYSCVAMSSAGRNITSCNLTVTSGIPREPEAPKTSSSATKVEAKEGESALLELTATGFPKPKVAWSKDGKELKPGDKYMVLQEDEETYTMAIKNVTKEDSGEYKALATNELGESALSYDLEVACSPKFTKQMKDTSVLKDETIKFEVEVDGRPEPTITWCKDGQQLSEGGRIKFESDGNIRRLVIQKATAEDSGNYSCTIRNKGGSQGGFGALQVKTPASFVQGLKDTSVSQGIDAAFNVKISGNPKPEFKWKMNGSDIKVDGSRIIQKEESSEEYTLIIKKTTIKDSGKYTCEIKNECGKDESSGKLSVKGKPNFSQELKDRTVKEGEKDVDLTVKIEGDSKPKVRWYIGDMEIVETTNYKIQQNEDEGTFTLRIKEVTPEVAGVYKCDASNEVGNNSTSATVKVVEEVKTTPPKFLQSLKDCSVKEGEDASFTVKIAGQPKPTIKWSKDGADLTIDKKRVKVTSEEEDSYTLVIKETTKQDAGSYTCTVTNTSGSESSSSKLTVTETETKASFEQGLKDITVKEEETAKFTVKIKGTPKPTAKWNKDGAELTVDNKRVQVTSEAEDSLTLIINKATKDDGGDYSCTVTNKVGSDTTSSKLTVKEAEKKPTFEQGLKDQSVKEEETLKLKVKFSGRPKPEVKWSKDGAELTIPNERVKVISEEEDSLTLVINQVDKNDAGKYSCTIKNTSGTETTSSKVTVTETESKPTFKQGLKDQTVKEEETVKLKVKFSGKPKPEAKWNKDGAELTLPGDRTKLISEEEDSLTLVIGPAKKDDTGKYSCVITNKAGTETTSSKLTVTESEVPPSFVQGLKNVSTKEEETVKLTVKFKGQPKPTAKWTKDGAELTIDNKRVKLITEADDSLTVVIEKVTLKDSGKYSCVITNTSGKDTSDCELTVTELQKAPTFRQGLKDITVKEEETAKFTVKFDGKPKPTAKWTKDGAELTIDGKKIKSVTEAEDSLTVIINQASKEDAGKYECTITNTCGSETTSSKLTVSDTLSSPSFKQGLKDQDIKEGDTATMTVQFTGKPKPSAKWTLDGAELTIDGKHILSKTEAEDTLTVIINQATNEDVGKYSCILTNTCGSATSSGKLRIKAVPIFRKGLEDTEGEEGGIVRMNVKYSGEPEPIAIWKKDGNAVEIDGKHVKVALEADDSQSLVFDSVKKEDVGTYLCEIKNPHGTASTSGKLTITGKPVVKKKLEDSEVLEGGNLELTAEVKATPSPDVKWYFKDREITAADTNYEMVEEKTRGVYKLIIKNAKSDHQGKYKLEASNPSGKADTTGNVSVLLKPAFLKPLSDSTVTEGESVKLETTATGNPKPDVTWFKEKKLLSSGDRFIISSTEESCGLTIKDSVIEDSSTYTCKAKNKIGEVSQKATVSVKSKRETQGPKFLSHIGDQVIVVGDAARFEAKIVGKPAPKVTWYKDGEELVGTDDVLIKSEPVDNTHTLTLKNLQIKDSATYECKAVNESGEAKESAKLTVKEPVAPKIEGLEDIEVRFSAPARIKAKISGFPKPEVKWLKNNVELKNDDLYEITKDSDHDKYSLSVKSVKGNEAGEYICSASNSAGQDEAKSVISAKAQAPIFMKEMKDVSIELGENFRFQVEVHGYPTPTVTWLKDNNALPEDARFSLSEKDYTYTLEVKDGNLTDAGLYTCKAINSAGEERCKGNVKILDFAPIMKQKLPESVHLIEGDQLHLKAKVSGQPTPEVRWMKDGKPLKPSNKIKTTLLPDGTAELIVDDVTHDDSGPYRLVAVNDKGQASSETNVSVDFAEKKIPPFVRQLHDVEIITGNPLTLEAKVSGFPKPTITWFKDGAAVDGQKVAPNAKASVSPDGTALLTIERAVLEDAGEYKLTATNELGEDNSSAVVKVSLPGKKPQIHRELKPMRFSEHATAEMETKVSGYPEPKVSWLQNGRNILEDGRCFLSYGPNGEATLKITDLSKEDGGLYTVVASNKLGKVFSEAPLTVVPVVKTEEKAPKKIFEFLQSLMPALVPEGRPLKLEAQVTTDPVPVYIRWCKDGKDLAPNEKIEITQTPDGVLKLCIKQMTLDDRGKYAVIASDGQAEIKSDAVVTMVPALPGMAGNKPYFVKGLQPVKLSEGEKLTLQAVLAPDMKASIKWMKDGEEIPRGGRAQMLEQPDGTVALVIDGATPEDSGKYVVIATNEDGKTRSSANVAVIGHGFKLPEIMDVLKPASFLQGEPAKLEARVSGEPKPDIKWLHDGEEVKPSDRIKMSVSPDGKVALEIKDIQPDDGGKYTLVISNIGGETRCSAPITVNQPPIFAEPLKPTSAVEGYPNKLEAKITGDPLPEIKWLKNGAEIPKDSDHVKQVRQPDGTASLIFDNCLPDDAGSYAITAKNPFGDKSSDADFKVISRDVEGQPKAAPTFVTPLSDISVPEGEPFKLEATIGGNPLPHVQWYLGGQPIGISDNIVPIFDGKKVSLTVYRSNPLHAGEYECRLSTDLGEAKSNGKVSVLSNRIPKFIERLSDTEFSGNDEMKLMCRVEGIPSPDIKWYYNGCRVEPGLKYTLSREGDKCLLVLPRPRTKDSGVYECRAKNIVGSDACKANITVSPSGAEGEPAMFLKKLRDIGVLPGMTAKFIACITGVPKPDIKWFKDGVQLSRDNRRTLESDPNGVIRLLIRSVTKSDIGTYRVSISNMYGSETCTATLALDGKEIEKDNMPLVQEVAKPVKGGPPAPLAHAPYILKMSDVCVSLAWRPSIPQYPQVPFTYRLEMCRDPDGEWSTFKSGIKDSCCDVRDLVPMKDYKFRIRVENKYGLSEPSPYVTAHRSKLIPPPPQDHRPKDYDLEHQPLEKFAAAPRFLRQEEESIYAVRGQPARVEFWVYGHPQPKITWYFNNVEVDTGKYDFLEDRNGQVIMFITRMSDADVGFYTCKAVNEHGEAQQKIKLMIAETPIFTKRLDEHTFMLRAGGEMECHVTGLPDPKIKWFKDWHPISDSSRIKISWTSPGTCVLSLSNSILKDCGLYTCTATNVAGTASTSAMLNIEECESEYHILTYKRPNFVKPSDRPLEDNYDIGDELGRGTQGITYHAVERKSGRSFGAKVMHGDGKLMDFMIAEMDVMNQLCHKRLVRLWNAYQTRSSIALVTDICGGGELLPNLLHRGTLTESIIAYYIRQLLEGLHHMHEKSIAHLGLTIGDLLITRLNSDSIKIGDFGLATRLYSGRNYIQEYGHPEYVAPEVANKQPVSLAADMWSVGIISYILLTGDSPFLKENDRETLKMVQKGNADFYNDRFVVLSDEARDFVTNLLSVDPSKRMDVNAALKHPWLEIASLPDKCDELNNMEQLKEYYKKWKSWYANASCRRYYRRRTLESCFTHPSRMIYPPDEEYTPQTSPDRELGRSRVKPSEFDDVTFQQKIEREPIDVRSESHYQNGPDTFLLPLRDPDFPVRIRRYLKVGARRSPILARHLADKHWGYGDVAVKERRKFVDVMDEEIDDEKRGLSQSAPLRLRHEVGTVGSGYDKIEMKCLKKKRGYRMAPGTAPYFREKIQDVVIREGQEAEFSCCAAANPEAQFSWFRNDGILIESSRIEVKKWSDGQCHLFLKPAKAYDVGVYKCVARNAHGIAICRARLNIGSVPSKPEPPLTENCSDTEVYLTWMPPKFEGHCTTLGYSLEYRVAGEENWTKVANNISHEFFLVHDLKPSTTYYFRLSALNKFGWSEFSDPSEPTLTLTESAKKIELSRAEKFQQSQTESGQALIIEEPDRQKLDYGHEEDPVTMEDGEPTELYNFIADVARGRFSIVTKVWVEKANTAMMAKALVLNEATSRLVEREFEIYKSLQHERIPVLHSASRSPTSVFLIMEKLSGIDVLTYLSSKAVYTEEMVSQIIHQVIDALEYLHFRSICYFELQPDNVVMVDRHQCQIKLVDFGSAQYVPEEGAKVKVEGCLEYLAPEVIKGEDVHSAVDIWGVGVLTYILLSGVSPFAGESDLETKDNILYVRYHFDHLYKEVSQEATHFLMQLFKRTPQKRPTAEECLDNKWLLPNEFMIKKREHTVFLSHHLSEFSEQFHSVKAKSTPPVLLNIFGKSASSGSALP